MDGTTLPGAKSGAPDLLIGLLQVLYRKPGFTVAQKPGVRGTRDNGRVGGVDRSSARQSATLWEPAGGETLLYSIAVTVWAIGRPAYRESSPNPSGSCRRQLKPVQL